MTGLSADLIARSLIAASISFGEHPSLVGSPASRRRALVLSAAAFGLHHATRAPIGELSAILGIDRKAIIRRQNEGDERFYKAAEQAELAARHHIAARRCQEMFGTLAAAVQPVPSATVIPTPPSHAVRRGRRIPRGAQVHRIGGGVEVIRLKPVTPSITRHAAEQARNGVCLDDLAELFSVDPESLARAVKAHSA